MNKELTIKSPEDLTRVINTSPYVVLKFSADWCGSCKRIKEPYIKLRNKHASENIKFIEFDINEHDHIVDDKKYYNIKIRSIPYFLISTDGSFTHQFTGGDSIDKIDTLLSKLSKE
jgi:thiol-disulfide isomerase/thioredoxin